MAHSHTNLARVLIFKQTDIYVQFAAIAVPVLIALFVQRAEYIAMIYISLGGVQVLSCAVNRIFLPGRLRSRSRAAYEAVLAALTIILVTILAADRTGSDMLFLPGLALLFVSPFLALWYLIMTKGEAQATRLMMQRPAAAMNNEEILNYYEQ